MENMETLDGVTVALQSATLSVSNTRVFFDTVIAKFPELEERLGSSASVLHSAEFESAICKLQDKRPIDLSDGKQKFVCCLLVQTGSGKIWKFLDGCWPTSQNKSTVPKNRCDEYVDLRFMLPFSNHC